MKISPFLTDPHWHLQAAVPPRAADHGQGGRGQQLRPGSLHHRQGADRGHTRQDQEAGREHLWTPGKYCKYSKSKQENLRRDHFPGFPGVSQFWWRHRIWVRLAAAGETQGGVQEEASVGLLHLPEPPGAH